VALADEAATPVTAVDHLALFADLAESGDAHGSR
jgi:hypothetical protein